MTVIPASKPGDLLIPSATPSVTIVVDAVLQMKVAEVVAEMHALPEITDQRSFDAMRTFLVRVSGLKGDLEAQRTQAKKPFSTIANAIDAAARPFRQTLEDIIEDGKRQETEFLRERDRQIAEQQAAVRAAEAEAARTASRPTPSLLPAAQAMVPIEAIKAPLTRRQMPRVFDETQIPAEYWMIDMAKVEADLRAGKVVPGAALVEETSVRVG